MSNEAKIRTTGNFDALQEFFEAHGKKDRAVAIVGAAFMNAHLMQLLKAFFVDEASEAHELLDYEKPLGGIGPRIRLAYCLGLISKDERDDLRAIQQISELFSREMEELTFSDEDVRLRCRALKLPRKLLLGDAPHPPRRLFVFAIAQLVQELTRRISQAIEHRCHPADEYELVQIVK